jgi:hypothetical protein
MRTKIWCCMVQAGDARKNNGAWVCALKYGVVQSKQVKRIKTIMVHGMRNKF